MSTPAPQSATLVVIRGNSGSGKTTIAREVRRRYGRGAALVEQDHFRRVVLREHGGSAMNPVAPGFIEVNVRYLLGAGSHVVLEGILDTRGYGAMLRRLLAEHAGPSRVFYLDVDFDETVRRHAGRAEPIPVTAEQMREWYVPRDLLGVDGEHVIPQTSTFEQTVAVILHTSGLPDAVPMTPCPVRCPRCADKSAERGHAPPNPAGSRDAGQVDLRTAGTGAGGEGPGGNG